MTVIHSEKKALSPGNKPDWCQTPYAGYFRMPRDGGKHDCHYHDFNELYLICRGKAKILNAGEEYYVKAHDIVCIKVGDEHDILEIYSDEDFELFWLYEPGPGGEIGAFASQSRASGAASGSGKAGPAGLSLMRKTANHLLMFYRNMDISTGGR